MGFFLLVCDSSSQIQTWDGWVQSVNATTVLCRPPFFPCSSSFLSLNDLNNSSQEVAFYIFSETLKMAWLSCLRQNRFNGRRMCLFKSFKFNLAYSFTLSIQLPLTITTIIEGVLILISLKILPSLGFSNVLKEQIKRQQSFA